MVLNDACPVAGSSGTVRNTLPSTRKVTVPVGLPAPGLTGVTAAVTVAISPKTVRPVVMVKVVVVADVWMTVKVPGTSVMI